MSVIYYDGGTFELDGITFRVEFPRGIESEATECLSETARELAQGMAERTRDRKFITTTTGARTVRQRIRQ